MHLSLLGAFGHRAVTRRATSCVSGWRTRAVGRAAPLRPTLARNQACLVCGGGRPPPRQQCSRARGKKPNQIQTCQAEAENNRRACMLMLASGKGAFVERGFSQLAGQAASSTSGSSTGAALPARLAPPAARHTVCSASCPQCWPLLTHVHAGKPSSLGAAPTGARAVIYLSQPP